MPPFATSLYFIVDCYLDRLKFRVNPFLTLPVTLTGVYLNWFLQIIWHTLQIEKFSVIIINPLKKPLLLRTMTFSFTLLRFFSHFLGPTEDIPVKVTGNVNNGFTAESVPIEVGIYMILLEYKGLPPTPTPLYSTKILWIPTSVGSDPAVNPFLTLLLL